MNNSTGESGSGDCLICFSKIENYDVLLPGQESQKIVDHCMNYLHESIANIKLQNVESENENELPLCKKCFETVSKLMELSGVVSKAEKKISNLSFEFSLGVLARRTQVEILNNLPDGQNSKEFIVLDVSRISPSLFSTDQTPTEVDDFSHPCENNFVGMDAALTDPQHIFEIVKHESEELVDEESAESVDDTNLTRDEEFPAFTLPVVVLKRLKEAKVSEKFNSKSSPQHATSNASSLKRQLRHVTSKQKGQSTSSNIIHPKTGSGNLTKAKKSVKVRGKVGRVGKKEHKCHLCEKLFPASSNLEKHIRIHTGEKPFTCSFCAKGFNQKAHLKKHEMFHTGEKPFKCSFCLTAFTESSNLQAHIRSHTGEKPFKCSFCVKTFAQSSYKQTHERIHTGERPFKCFQCPKAFSHSYSLKYHLALHVKEKTSEKC